MLETELDVHETEAQTEERLRKRREKDSARKALVASSESQEERAS